MPNDFKITKITVNVDVSRAIDRTGIHLAMAQRYRQIVLETFGPVGRNRQVPWPALSKAYARRVNPPLPTLKRQQGRIYNSIVASADANAGHVSSDSQIGVYHQFGMGRNPRRPFFPFDLAGNPTPYVASEMNRVVREFLGR